MAIIEHRLSDNPIIRAFMDEVIDPDLESSDGTLPAVLELWIWYMATGNQDVSWSPAVMAEANAYFKFAAASFGVEYTEGMTGPVS